MEYQGGLGTDGDGRTCHRAKPLLVDHSVLADCCVRSLGDVDGGHIAVGIEDDNDVSARRKAG